MAGRHHLPPPKAAKPSVGDSRVRHRLAGVQASSAGLEERVAIQHREIHALVLDNQRLAATHVALKQELAAAQLDLRAIADAKAQCDARVRDAYERSLKADAEARLAGSAAAEVDRVRADARKLAASRDELAKELKDAQGDLAGAREGLKQVDDVKAEIDSVRREIQRGRAAIEREKKTRAQNLEFRKAMEEKMVSMAAEIEKLHAELANVDRRARAAAAAANPNPVYGAIPFSLDMGFGRAPYPEPYNIHKVPVVGQSGAPYGSGPLSHGSGDIQQTNIYR